MTSDHGWKFIDLFPLKWFSFIELKLLFSISMLDFFEYESKKYSPVQSSYSVIVITLQEGGGG